LRVGQERDADVAARGELAERIGAVRGNRGELVAESPELFSVRVPDDRLLNARGSPL
jgi:hypothetical protein